MSEQTFDYVGGELEVFRKAINWKKYWGGKIRPYLGKSVLEVGAGIGGTTRVLCTPDFDSWLGIEPDVKMTRRLQQQREEGRFPSNCQFRASTVQDLPDHEVFDSILYIDVLEHIEPDRDEVRHAALHLNPGGYLIVLSPAFPFLFTEFDAAIGHYRRYTRKTLLDLTPPTCDLTAAFYLDTVGMLASLGNLLLLRKAQPTDRQIWFWDSVMVPISQQLDWITRFSFGRSVLCVWRRREASAG